MADKSQKTEPPTQWRIEKARREGHFPAAAELVGAVQFLALVALLAWAGHAWFTETRQDTAAVWRRAFAADLRPGDLPLLARGLLLRRAAPLLWAGCAITLLGIAARLASSRMGLALKQLTPDLQRLNPFSRLRELPRQNLPALLQAITMLPLFAGGVYLVVRGNLESYLTLPLQTLEIGFQKVALSLRHLLWQAAGLFVAFGILDFVRQRRRYRRDLRMSKQEIREEFREVEGHPQTKLRIRALRRRMAAQERTRERISRA